MPYLMMYIDAILLKLGEVTLFHTYSKFIDRGAMVIKCCYKSHLFTEHSKHGFVYSEVQLKYSDIDYCVYAVSYLT